MADPTFDPSQPFQSTAPTFDPAQPFEPDTGSAPAPTSAQPTFLQKMVAGPGSFVKGAIVDPILGAAQMANEYNPLNQLTDAALQMVAPQTLATIKQHEQVIPNAVENYYQQARAATGKTGTDWGQIGGEIAGIVAPTPLGKEEAIAKIPAAVEALPGLIEATPSAAARAYDYVSGLMGSKTPQEIADIAAKSGDKGLTTAEALGSQGVKAAAALGRREGATGDTLAATILGRQQEAPARILSDFASASGIAPEAARGDMDALIAKGRQEAAPLYDAAYGRGVVRTKKFSALMQSPAMQAAIGRATQIFGNEYAAARAAEGAGAATPEQWNQFVSAVSDKTAFPTKFLDYVKRGMDSYVESFRDPITQKLNLRDPLVRSAQDIRGQFVQEAKRMNPVYGQALDVAGDYLGSSQAFENGQRFITSPTVTAKQFSDHLGNLSESEVQAFKGGVANKMYDMAQSGRLGPKAFQRPIIKQKLSAILGSDAATEFLGKMELESQMAKSGARMLPGSGSITSDMLNATNEQDIGGKLMGGLDALAATGHLASGNLPSTLARGTMAAKRFGAFAKTGGMPLEVRDAAGKLLLMPPDQFADLARQIGALSRKSAPVSTVFPNLGLLGSDITESQ